MTLSSDQNTYFSVVRIIEDTAIKKDVDWLQRGRGRQQDGEEDLRNIPTPTHKALKSLMTAETTTRHISTTMNVF